MSHYIGIRGKIKIYKEFEEIVSSTNPYKPMKESSDEIMQLLSQWHEVAEYTGNIDKWNYDKDTEILEFDLSYNLKYFQDWGDMTVDCFLPYITKEVIEEYSWDDGSDDPPSRSRLKNSISKISREKLVSFIKEDLEDWLNEYELELSKS